MAAEGDSHYFPPLDRCLNGDLQLLSWKTVFLNLHGAGNQSLESYLLDGHVIKIISQFLTPFDAPSSQSRATFDTLTSAINITPTSPGRYDIKEIKEDALWLSQKADIDEVTALRIVVIEQQSRSATKLLEHSIQHYTSLFGDSTSVNVLSSSFMVSNSTIQKDYASKENSHADDSNSLHGRQFRILETYLSERRYLSDLAAYTVSGALYKQALRSTDETGINHQELDDAPTEAAGARVLKSWKLSSVQLENGKNWVINAIAAVETRIGNLERGSTWTQNDSTEGLEILWSHTQTSEVINVLQTLLLLVDSSPQLTRTDALLTWYRFVQKYRFFKHLELPYEETTGAFRFPFRSLIALVSLALLKLPLAIETLQKSSTLALSAADSTDEAPYLFNPDAIDEVNGIVIEAAKSSYFCASPAVFAWAIILHNLRNVATSSQETRELRQSQRAVDSFGALQYSDSESNDSNPGQRRASPLRRSSFGSDSSQQVTFLEDVYSRVQNAPLNEEIINFLARKAVDEIHVYEIITSLAVNFCTPFGSDHQGAPGLRMRSLLLDLISASLDHIEYQPVLVEATLAVLLGGERHWNREQRPSSGITLEPAFAFLNNDDLMQRVFNVALSRFPYECTPFLRLCGAVARGYIVQPGERSPLQLTLDSMDSFTCILPEGAASYVLRGDADSIHVELTSSLDVFSDQISFRKRSKLSSIKSLHVVRPSTQYKSFQLPIGTLGRCMTDGKPLVILWRHKYSCLRYLGMLLQHIVSQNALTNDQRSSVVLEVVTEIISLLNGMLMSCPSDERDAGRTVLEEASDGLDRNHDIVSLIFSIFETELHRRHSVSGEEGSIELFIQCIYFTHALIAILPGRVWPFLGRSGLLALEGTDSKLIAVTTSIEVPSGKFDFLLGSIRVFDALLRDTVIHAVSRKSRLAVPTRFSEPSLDTISPGVPDTIIKKVLLALGHIMVDVHESTRNWRFGSTEEKFEINAGICDLFSTILLCCHGVDDDQDINRKVLGVLAPTAAYLIDIFLSKTANNAPLRAISESLLEGSTAPPLTSSDEFWRCWQLQTSAAVKLCTTFLRTIKYLGQAPGRLEDMLFKATPVLSKIYAASHKFRLPVTDLLEALVRSAGSSDKQTSSLLGHLGQKFARYFLDLLSVLGQPLEDKKLAVSIWKLLTAIVSQRQQWFAIYLLTGSTPRETLKEKSRKVSFTSSHVRPMLGIALDRIQELESLDQDEAVAMMEFISIAADFWPWAMEKIEENPSVINAFSDFLARLEPPLNGRQAKTDTPNPQRIQLTSYIVDILTLCAYQHNQKGDSEFAKKIMKSLNYLIANGVATPAYNTSLHSNLRKNFDLKFPSCKLTRFKKTSLQKSQLGKDFFYNTEFAGAILEYDPAWNRVFKEELSRANMNLSVVEAQVNLFRSWKSLAIELSDAFSKERTFPKSLTLVVRHCLQFNLENTLPEAIFDNLSQTRADLTFLLLQRVLKASEKNDEAYNMLKLAWDTLRSHTNDIGLALTGPTAAYDRTLLRILYLTLQVHIPAVSDSESPTTQPQRDAKRIDIAHTVLEILGMVVAQGFRSLTSLLHDPAYKVQPVDFTLIISILRSSLRIPGIETHPQQLVTMFTDDNTTRYASTLLSWSDQIAIDGDPIFAELSMDFLTELSTVSALAESTAAGGILTQIASSKIMEYFRRTGGIGPFEEPTRMYGIWCRNILPMALNLLGAIGAPIAAEVAAFLNQFSGQLVRAAGNLELRSSTLADNQGPHYISLMIASEVHSLALIASILDMFRAAGARAGINAADIPELAWERSPVKGDLENCLQRRHALRESVVATNEIEESWSRQKAAISQSEAENRLEEKVVEELSASLRILQNESYER